MNNEEEEEKKRVEIIIKSHIIFIERDQQIDQHTHTHELRFFIDR